MTDGEKMVWAAVYSTEYIRQHEKRASRGTAMYIPQAIELAWSAVKDLTNSVEIIKEGWGESDDVYLMLEEMLKEETRK